MQSGSVIAGAGNIKIIDWCLGGNEEPVHGEVSETIMTNELNVNVMTMVTQVTDGSS